MIKFATHLNSVVDVITNSSAELFVSIENDKKEIEQLLDKLDKGWRYEYHSPKNIDELSDEELREYCEFAYELWPFGKEKPEPLPGFKYDEMFSDDGFLRANFFSKNREKIINSLDPEHKMVFLFSKFDNPSYELQKRISFFMTKYHLG